MSEEETIRQFIAHHTHLRGDLCMDEWAAQYAEDARMTVSGGMTSTGRGAILESQTTFLSMAHTRKHFIGPSVVCVDGDHARAATDFIYIALNDDSKIEILTAGRYNDWLVRGEDGQWQIQVREVARLNDGTPNAGKYRPGGSPEFPFKP